MKTYVFMLKPMILATLIVSLSSCDRPSMTQPPQSAIPSSAGSPVPAGYEGNFEAADCQFAVGWLRDLSKPEGVVTIDVYDGTTSLGQVNADIFRQDLKDAGKGTGKHGFQFVLPATVKDGVPHAIGMKVAGTDSPLYGSPRTITCSDAAPQP